MAIVVEGLKKIYKIFLFAAMEGSFSLTATTLLTVIKTEKF